MYGGRNSAKTCIDPRFYIVGITDNVVFEDCGV